MDIADKAVQVAYRFEAKKDALRQTQDGGIKVTFTIQPDDMPTGLYTDPMGQRYVMACVPVDENESPKGVAGATPPLGRVAGAVAAGPKKTLSAGGDHAAADQPKRKWDDIPYSQRAGMLCDQIAFQEFIGVLSAESAATYVREYCGVQSRREIKPGTPAAEKFEKLCRDYDTWIHFERSA